eukprot:m.22278 g.22278  ORF g.22278 m.22278 type:complete len:55 (+) comp11226_c0_seq2:2549-2713(+)
MSLWLRGMYGVLRRRTLPSQYNGLFTCAVHFGVRGCGFLKPPSPCQLAGDAFKL